MIGSVKTLVEDKILAKLRGPDADPNWQYLVIPLSSIVVMACFAGAYEGYILRVEDGEDAWRHYVWRIETVLSNAGLWLFWGFGMWVSGGVKLRWAKWAGRIWLSFFFVVSIFTLLAFVPPVT